MSSSPLEDDLQCLGMVDLAPQGFWEANQKPVTAVVIL